MGDPRITATIPLKGLGGIAVNGGAAWVGVEGDGNKADYIARVDLRTNQVVAKIPVPNVPGRKRIAATEDSVWVASTGLLERIDLSTNEVVARVMIPDRFISAIEADSSAVWAVTIDRSGAGILVRVDPARNEVVAKIPLGSQIVGYEDEVRIGAGSVWVIGARWLESSNTEYGSDLIRIDPRTNAVVARIPVGGFDMVVGNRDVWVRFPADGAFDGKFRGGEEERWLWTRVDVRTNKASEPFRFRDTGLALVTSQGLWSVGYDEQENVRVTRFDPETLEIEARSEPIRSYFHDAVLDPKSGTVWISALDKLVRIDITE
ncbi:MAG: hypothetical protein WD276_00890 [Actinomycetota bacterium]